MKRYDISPNVVCQTVKNLHCHMGCLSHCLQYLYIVVLNRYRYRYRPISAIFADIGIGRYNIGIFGRYRYLNIAWKTCHFWGLTTKNSRFLLINLVSMQFMKISRENMSFLRFNYWKFPNFANKPRIYAIHENIAWKHVIFEV